jgi:3-isopropylmalate/(R)-2-methylmalate dehydratase small subunit
LADKAFYDWRHDENGKLNDHPLNTLDRGEHRILVAGDNFACGSSREHAPWALADYGFRAIISTSIADIFRSNALNNGLVPIIVDSETHQRLLDDPGGRVVVDLERLELTVGNAEPIMFSVEPFARRCLLDGVDALGWLCSRLPQIEAFEHERMPT